MLSFGMETARAFSIAFWSARFAAGSGPPSRAATMIARESFENSFPRFASAAPFLCLIDDHLLCPDTALLSHQLQEALVDARIIRQLGMERRDEKPPLPQEHRLAVKLCEHLHVRPDRGHSGRADEDPAQRRLVALELEIGLEARHLAAVRVPRHLDVDEPEPVTAEQDQAGARAEDGAREAADRLLEAVETHQPRDR